ncbi:MAG TPA: family 78 glycoside hydrolase catalytic domain [Prolixibacteraceae bacterium]|nr:family 78 glycoside hydrolase catalytic domain [Prolixibacteraceae bacterium]
MRSTIIEIALFLLLLNMASCSSSRIEVLSTTCNYKTESVGVDPSIFHLGWKLRSDARNTVQIAYQLVLAENTDQLNSGNFLWNSGKTESSNSIRVPYSGKKLESGKTYCWKVKVWDNHGNESKWSWPAYFTTGLFSGDDWGRAQWIALDSLGQDKRIVPGIHLPGKDWSRKAVNNHKLPIFRKEFDVKTGLEKALVFVCGLGQYELSLNGRKVGNCFLSPGWTHYDAYALYNTYDVTQQLTSGANALGLMLGNGFFIIPNERYRKVMTAYGNPMLILKLQLEYADGTVENLVTDPTWKVCPGPLTFSSIFGGETYDANREQTGWDLPGFDDSEWAEAIPVPPVPKELRPETDYPVTIRESLNVREIVPIDASKGFYLYDFAQNASGIISIKIKGNKGDTVNFYPAELKKDDNRAEQKATGSPYYFTYILKGEGVESWTPKFSYYGFRYVEVRGAHPESYTGNSSLPRILDMKLEHISNSSPRIGHFKTSYQLFNRIDTLIDWAIRSNYVSLLTDCPHREKLGWLEQVYLMGGSVHYNYDVYHTLCKQIDDMIAAQTPDGLVPDIAPEYTVFWEWFRDSPEWGSACIQVPYLVYKWYGDTDILERSWNMMERYACYLRDTSVNHIVDHGLGDWFDLGPERPGIAQLTPRSLTGTALYYSDVKLLSEMAAILGKTGEQRMYEVWAGEIKEAFNRTFLDPETKVYSTGSQTAISMPLVLGLVDEEDKTTVFQTLVESIEKDNKALTAGDIGFHYLVKALQENGGAQLLYEMNARDDVPGYGYQLKKGATALTESWQAMPIVSNNHLMLGHLMEWFYSGLGGIGQTDRSIGFREIRIAPQMVGDIQQTSTSFETPYGMVKCEWKKYEKGLKMVVEIPVNTSALVEIPVNEGQTITEGGRQLCKGNNMTITETKEGIRIVRAGSGTYTFRIE